AALCVASLHLLLFVCVFLLFFCFPSALSSSLFPYTTLFRSFFLRTIMIDSYQKCVHLGNILSVGTARKCRAVPLEIVILLDFVWISFVCPVFCKRQRHEGDFSCIKVFLCHIFA